MRIIFFIVFVIAGTCNTQAAKTKEGTPKGILKIEDFMPDKKSWSFSTGVNILNSAGEGDYPVVYISQVGLGQYIVDRTTRSYDKENNGISGFISGMYGITDKISLATTLNGQWINSQYHTSDNIHTTKNEFRFNGVGLGLSYQLYSLSDFTVLYGGLNINEGEVKNYTLGSSVNWIYDPLVFSLSLGYLDGISKEKFTNDYVAYVTAGKVIFSINPEVNLNWGVSRDFTKSYGQYGNKKYWRSTTSILAGTTLNLAENLSGNINVKGGVGNNRSSVISLGLNYKM